MPLFPKYFLRKLYVQPLCFGLPLPSSLLVLRCQILDFLQCVPAEPMSLVSF